MHSSLTLIFCLPALVSAAESNAAASNAATRSLAAFQNMMRGSGGGGQEAYTMNAACLPNFCINPVIPGLMFLGESVLEQNKKKSWTCASIANTKSLFKLGGFCSRVIAAYPFAMPQAGPGDNATEAGQIQGQAYKALETYVGHLSGMGFDFWDHTTPWEEEDECIKSVWKMSCYTHFPRCNEISQGEYLPPCRSSCENYLSKCQVQCCDEGVQCTFEHSKKLADGTVVVEHGYPDHKGPSPLCTGGAARSFSAVAAAFFAVFAAMQF